MSIIDPNWQPYIRRSVQKHFIDALGAINYQLPELRRQDGLTDWYEIRIHSLGFDEQSAGFWKVEFTIDILSIMEFQPSTNVDAALERAALIASKFVRCLSIVNASDVFQWHMGIKPGFEIEVKPLARRAGGTRTVYDYSISCPYLGHI